MSKNNNPFLPYRGQTRGRQATLNQLIREFCETLDSYILLSNNTSQSIEQNQVCSEAITLLHELVSTQANLVEPISKYGLMSKLLPPTPPEKATYIMSEASGPSVLRWSRALRDQIKVCIVKDDPLAFPVGANAAIPNGRLRFGTAPEPEELTEEQRKHKEIERQTMLKEEGWKRWESFVQMKRMRVLHPVDDSDE